MTNTTMKKSTFHMIVKIMNMKDDEEFKRVTARMTEEETEELKRIVWYISMMGTNCLNERGINRLSELEDMLIF